MIGSHQQVWQPRNPEYQAAVRESFSRQNMMSTLGARIEQFKINLLAPARGETFLAQGRVIRPGRTLTVCLAPVFGEEASDVNKPGPTARRLRD